MKSSSHTVVIERETGCAELLSRFFPSTPAVRIPVQVTALSSPGGKLKEATVLEFGGPEYAIFLCTLPLEFDDRVRLESEHHQSAAEANVVAVQYQQGRKAVAVKFQHSADWMTRA